MSYFGLSRKVFLHGHRYISHATDGKGLTERHPHLFKVDLSGDKLVLGEEYNP